MHRLMSLLQIASDIGENGDFKLMVQYSKSGEISEYRLTRVMQDEQGQECVAEEKIFRAYDYASPADALLFAAEALCRRSLKDEDKE